MPRIVVGSLPTNLACTTFAPAKVGKCAVGVTSAFALTGGRVINIKVKALPREIATLMSDRAQTTTHVKGEVGCGGPPRQSQYKRGRLDPDGRRYSTALCIVT